MQALYLDEKPRIRKCTNCYTCTGEFKLAVGVTPKRAFLEWQRMTQDEIVKNLLRKL